MKLHQSWTTVHPQDLPLPVKEVDLPLYRERTLALLRRYFCMALETGRLPSLLGRECFRSRVTRYHLHTFEGSVIFVHDMERCLDRLSELSRRLISEIVLLGYTEDEAARRLNMTRRQVVRVFPEALDELSAILLRVQLLHPGPIADETTATLDQVLACQGGG